MAAFTRGFETFDHTADVGIRAWGENLEHLFEEAGKALFSVMVDLNTVSDRKTHPLDLRAESNEDLIYAWLNELLFIFETERFVFKSFSVNRIDSLHLTAEGRGEALDRSKHVLYL